MYDMVTKPRLSRVDPDTRRDDIVAKASQLFLDEGFAATSMSTIARAVGGSKATLYKYFPTKEALFEAVMDARARAVLTPIGDATVPRDDPAAFLRAVGERLLTGIYAPEPMALNRVVVGDGFRAPDIAVAFFRMGPDPVKQLIADQLARFAAEGRLSCGDPVTAAEDFCALLRGEAHFRALAGERMPPDGTEIDAHVDRIVGLVLSLWCNSNAG